VDGATGLEEGLALERGLRNIARWAVIGRHAMGSCRYGVLDIETEVEWGAAWSR
jgi:hypothetical protein